MIHPNVRSTLIEAITPPVGYAFDTGVATTYSLDIGTLMVLPVHLAWLAASDEEAAQSDRIRLLEGLRRTTKRLSVFVDSGHLHIPRMPQALAGVTEEMIHEVQAPHGGAFHPKVWALRFANDGGRSAALIRLLVLSRNLTDDKSWDLNLCLEGVPRGRKDPENKDLADFVRKLPDLCRHKTPAGQRLQQLKSLADDLDRCEWEKPQGFSELSFHVLGMGKRPQPFVVPAADEVLVVSPFVSDSALERVAAASKHCVGLVARQEELALLREETRQLFQPLYVIDDDADLGAEEEARRGSHRGLHAKAIIWRKGAQTHALVGSANCTTAALDRGSNVEVMAELCGHHRQVGTPADWMSKDKGIGALLQPYWAVDAKALREQRQVEDALEERRRRIVEAGLHLVCVPDEGGRCRLLLHGAQALADIDAEVWAWPLTMAQEDRQRLLEIAPINDLGSFATHEVTSLTGFRVLFRKHQLLFGVELSLTDPPADREAAVLALLLKNRSTFLRYLALLLGELGDHGPEFDPEGTGTWFGSNAATDDTPPLFELMLKTFSREPSKLNYVASAVEKLQQIQTDAAEPVIPPDFTTMWQAFEEARRLEERQ